VRRVLASLVKRVAPLTERVGEIGLTEKQTSHLAKTMAKRLAALEPG
jgi:hypothetical protein